MLLYKNAHPVFELSYRAILNTVVKTHILATDKYGIM